MDSDTSNDQGKDAELFRRISAADRSAFIEFYDRYSGLMFSIAMRVLGERREAEDVLQDVFLQIWRRATDYDPGLGSASSWAVTLVRNKAIDRLRSRSRRLRLIEEISIGIDEPEGAHAPSANEALYGRQRADRIRMAVGELPRDQRLAIELAYFAGLSQTEIAGRLQQPLGTIKARIRRAMLKLRENLGVSHDR